jgi:hypothetical protein
LLRLSASNERELIGGDGFGVIRTASAAFRSTVGDVDDGFGRHSWRILQRDVNGFTLGPTRKSQSDAHKEQAKS